MQLNRQSFLNAALLQAVLLTGGSAVGVATAAEVSSPEQAVHVLNRLGYGARPGDIERVRQMGVQRYIEAQLDPASIPLPPALQQRVDGIAISRQTTGSILGEFLAVRMQAKDEDGQRKQQRRATIGRIAEETAQLRLVRAIDSPRQLEEVMVDFWFNHFNVFSGKGLDRALIAGYERDAIRPYVMGSFRDLLGATAKHPAMLFYLDNYLSTAADFQPRGAQKGAGAKAKASGLNENYARELMELHTLGVDGGYAQKDVTELARMLTGWTFDPRQLVKNEQSFRFNPERHDDGDKDWLGHHVASQGQREGEFALDVLAQHPATARHLSALLAQYFVQDAPPAALVERMAQRYLATHGDIRSVLRTLFSSPEFMAPAAIGSKFKTPYQFVISAARAADVPVNNVRPLLGALNQLGMPLYGCQTPDGYKNTQAAWLNPDALGRRIAFASTLASGKLPLTQIPNTANGDGMGQRQLERQAEGMPGMAGTNGTIGTIGIAGNLRPADLPPLDATPLLATLGPVISARTSDTVARNPPALRAAMLLGSPDFMQH